MASTRSRSNARAATRSGARPTIGVHGEDTLEMLFRFGGCTASQLQSLMGMQDTISRRTLTRLEANGYVTTTADFARYQERNALTGDGGQGRPPDYYYLTSRGVDYAGQLAGAEDNKESRDCYKRHGLPGLAAHSSIENRVILAAVEAASRGEGWRLGVDDVVCEAAFDYPLLTGEKKSASGSAVRLLYPDGEFYAHTPRGTCVYMMEVESSLRTRRLLRKLEDYASWFRKAELVRPLLVVGLSPGQAASMRRAAMDGLAASAGEWRKWSELFSRKAKGRGAAGQVSPHLLVGFAPLQDVEGMYASRGIEAPIWQVMDDAGGDPIALSLSEMALFASEGREMVYGVKEVS